MGALVAIILAKTLIYGNLDPKITFYFTLPSCQSCIEFQLQLMKDFLQPEDKILIFNAHSSDEEAKAQRQLIEETVKRILPNQMVQLKETTGQGIGWNWEDPYSHETVSYLSQLGSYDLKKSRSLLNLLR